jgi:hypothetical protein
VCYPKDEQFKIGFYTKLVKTYNNGVRFKLQFGNNIDNKGRHWTITLKTGFDCRRNNYEWGYDVIYDFLIGKIPSGLYNLRNEIDDKIPSRYDIACYIKQVLNSNCNILSISSDRFKSSAKRQLNSFLNINKIKQYYPHKFPTWKNVVDNYFK